MKILVTGGVRSGKSGHAERLVAGFGTDVTYVAPGPAYDDADWAARVARHREQRPAGWTTVESGDLATALAGATGPVLVDCLGTWVQGLLDERDLWEAPMEAIQEVVASACGAAVEALARVRVDVVLVTNEVGLGLVPAHRSGRVFADVLGEANQRFAAVCDRVDLVVAGRVLEL